MSLHHLRGAEKFSFHALSPVRRVFIFFLLMLVHVSYITAKAESSTHISPHGWKMNDNKLEDDEAWWDGWSGTMESCESAVTSRTRFDVCFIFITAGWKFISYYY
jgi:hypothetical protein